MAPMNWTLLFLCFIFIYMVCMIMIYFTVKPTLKESSYTTHLEGNPSVFWKW